MAEKKEKLYLSDNALLMAEWDWELNKGLNPQVITLGSHKKANWVCKSGHKWSAQIKSRDTGRGCPICAGKVIVYGFNDFASKFPELALEWHPQKNTGLTPEKVAPKSNKMVWWKCAQGHEWESKIEDRANGAGCPFCSHRRIIKGVTDLASVNPTLAREWHPSKNGILRPCDVAPYSSRIVWWSGECGHTWQATVGNRNQGTGCPICWREAATSFPEQAILFYCKQITVAIGRYTDLGKEIDVYLPEYAVGIEHNGYYHRDKRSRDDEKVRFFNKQGIRLISIYGDNENKENISCDDTIEYVYSSKETANLAWAITEMFKLIGVVPPPIDLEKDRIDILEQYIESKKANGLAINFPEIAKEWHPHKNGTLLPEMFYCGSHRKVWWLGKCGHEWQAVIQSRTQGSGCPVCAGKVIIKGENDFLSQCPQVAEEWHPTRNGTLIPETVSRNSHKRVWWKGKCGHEWQAQVKSRARGSGCPVCSGALVLAGYNDLETTSPILAAEWHPTKNMDLTPNKVSCGSEKKVWWKGKCGHEWDAIIKNRARGAGCPICAGRRGIPYP